MEISVVFQSLGCERFEELMSGVSIGKLRTFQAYDSLKVSAGLNKVNHAKLRKALPRLWSRLKDGDDNLADAAAQAILVSNLEFVIRVLDFLEIGHDGSGFFQKIDQKSKSLDEGWQKRAYNEFKNEYSNALILLYLNHLASEIDSSSDVFLG